MHDITMCLNEECDLAKGCARHPASGTKPEESNQTWARFTTWNDKKGCAYFLRKEARFGAA